MVKVFVVIIKAYGTTLFSSEHDERQKVDNMFKWCNVNIKEMTTRRRLIKDDIIHQSATTHSHSLRKAYINVMRRLGIGFANKYTNAEIAKSLGVSASTISKYLKGGNQ